MNYPTFDALNVSSKFAICGLPIRIDSYKTCSFGCKYCFANGRKVMEFKKDLQIANVDGVRKKLQSLFKENVVKTDSLLDTLIMNGITWHWGGMSDPFQHVNQELKVTNSLIDVCNEYDIHALFSTKSDTVHDANIRPDLHSFQLSVSNVNNRTDIEENVPSIDNRLAFFKELKSEGFKVGIRIQPFIPGISNIDIVKMFEGADHFIIEGIKVVPQNDEQKEFVFDYLGIPESMFTQMGLLNIKPEYRLSYYQPFIDYFKSHNISYSISDNDLRKYTNNSCCCGDKLITKSTSFNTTSMIVSRGHYTLKDVLEQVDKEHVSECKCSHLFTSNRTGGCVTVEQFYKQRFKQQTSPFSPKFQYNNDTQLSLF